MPRDSFIKGLDEDQKTVLKSIFALAEKCNYEKGHTWQVTQFALEIFDDLIRLHKLGNNERFYLLSASLLHDIGVHTEGPKKHHKNALKIILDTPILRFQQKERFIIGSIARYHRRALPSKRHDHFAALSSHERLLVSKSAGILRIADGLDYSHKQRVKKVSAKFNSKEILFACTSGKISLRKEIQSAHKKSDLLSLVFQRRVKFEIV
jgi:exopolyphosphatase/guanosine-5'-triphosphate,3'-diphosphate pyrophosphatase